MLKQDKNKQVVHLSKASKERGLQICELIEFKAPKNNDIIMKSKFT